MRTWQQLGAFMLLSSNLSLSAQASVLGIVDSGLDTLHKDLSAHIWLNANDSTKDGIDNDQNGLKDDVNGWNFIGNNGNLIEKKYGKYFDKDVARFFEVQAQALEGEASSEDIDWMKAAVGQKDFVKKLQIFGNYAHGTHVTGIAVSDNPAAQAMMVKLIPTENPLAGLSRMENEVRIAAEEGKELNWIVKEIIKGGLGLFAKAQAQVFSSIGSYLHGHKVDVANASLGMGLMQAEMIIKPLLRLAGAGQNPPPALLQELAIHFLQQVNAEQEILLKNAPDTLFVFAAGNEGIDNDLYPTAPASIDHPYKLSVAASFADGQLAPFSNYGAQKVDIAAPGVAIVSTIPDDRQLALSGTSQAAPYVAGVAANIKDINPELGIAEIKTILMQTVDKLDALKTKVKSGGVANRQRALYAAELSRSMPLARAIAEARASVPSALVLPEQRAKNPAVWIAVPSPF
jgi:subtilisin family serine protease